MQKPTLAVVMCVYQGDNDKHFFEALNSLKNNQKFINEIIISVNGPISSYKKNIIKTLKKELNILPIYIPSNLGIAKGLNLAILKSNSEWIIRFDSDDICEKNRFKFINEKINKYGNKYDVMGTYIQEFITTKKNLISVRKVPLSNNEIKKRLLYANPMNHVSVFFKKSITYKFRDEPFYPLIDGFEDYALWAKLLKNKFKFKNFPVSTVFVRVGNNMIARRGGLKYILKEINLRFYINKFIKPHQIPTNMIITILRVLAFSLPLRIKKIIYRVLRKP